MASSIMRRLPFARSTTPLQALTYLLGISLFSISFLVFLNSSISFVITDLIGVKTGVGDIVGTLGFVDELVALIACPAWGLVSDRLGVRLVAVLGYAVIALALVLSVQAVNVYPQLLLARILFAIGATAAATMVTAILPVLTDESASSRRSDIPADGPPKSTRNPRHSSLSIESQLTITPERFAESQQRDGGSSSSGPARATRRSWGYGNGNGMGNVQEEGESSEDVEHGKGAPGGQDVSKPGKLAGFVGLFTGCGALVALSLFLPLPAQFGRIDGVTMAEAVARSFYVVALVAVCVAVFVFFGLRGLRGEEGKGWRLLLGRPVPVTASSLSGSSAADAGTREELISIDAILAQDASSPATPGNPADADTLEPVEPTSTPAVPVSAASSTAPVPYWRLMRESVRLGFTDADISLGYLGGFVARASSVAISLFVPLFVNAFFIRNGFCQGSPHDSSPELKKECRAAYVLASILTGVAQLMGLLCAPLFGYLSSRRRSGRGGNRVNVPIVVSTVFGIVGYIMFALLRSPEFKDEAGRGGSPIVFLAAALIGISQIGAIVCSLGSLGKGVLAVDGPPVSENAAVVHADADVDADAPEGAPLLAPSESGGSAPAAASRIRLKGSIAGVYSWCGGAAILLLTKLGGYLFDKWSTGAPFYLMALFNAALLVASVSIDAGGAIQRLWKRGGHIRI